MKDPKPKGKSGERKAKLSDKPNTAITVAWIGLMGTIIAALLSSPLLEKLLAPTSAPSSTSTVTLAAPSSTDIPMTSTVAHMDVVSPTVPTELSDMPNAQMILIPAGEFTMGSDEGNDDEEPVHKVYLDDFFIDTYEVTNVMYKACVEDSKCEAPKDTSSWTRAGYFDNAKYDNYPVIYVTWSMAKTFCEWREARLPSEAEWEKAARGTDQRIYPWGVEIDATFANYGESVGDTTPVGSYEKGKSYYGVYDMAGNVWEWVADWYSDSYYQNAPSSNPLGPDSGEFRVLRGGSKDMKPAQVRTTARGSYDPNGIASDFGFRCAKDTDP